MLRVVLFGYGKKSCLQVCVFGVVPGGGGRQRCDTRVDAAGVMAGKDVREPSTPNFCLLVIAEQRHDEEAVIDQGRTSNVVNIHYEKEELEGESPLRPRQRGHQHKVPAASLARRPHHVWQGVAYF